MNTRPRLTSNAATLAEYEIIDAVNGGIIMLDRNAHVVRWNLWMAHASGLAESTVKGKSLAELFPAPALRRTGRATPGMAHTPT